MDPQMVFAGRDEQCFEHVMSELGIFGLVRDREHIRFLPRRNSQVLLQRFDGCIANAIDAERIEVVVV